MAIFGEGDAGKDLLWLVILFLVLGVVWIFTGGPARFEKENEGSSVISPPDISLEEEGPTETSKQAQSLESRREEREPSRENEIVNPKDSLYKGEINLRLGRSGEKSGNIDEEYIILDASSRNSHPITISGWKIDNGKSEKTYIISGKIYSGRSTVAMIPYGTMILTGEGNSPLVPIVLNPGEKAYIISGRVPIQLDYKIDASFKQNRCSGYLGKLPHYTFTPRISGSCPRYNEELNMDFVPDRCRPYVTRYGASCLTPELKIDREEGKLIDGRDIPSACRSFILDNFNYTACLAKHALDEDFYGKIWYVYLNRTNSSLYADKNATITLYDNQGKVVDTYSY